MIFSQRHPELSYLTSNKDQRNLSASTIFLQIRALLGPFDKTHTAIDLRPLSKNLALGHGRRNTMIRLFDLLALGSGGLLLALNGTQLSSMNNSITAWGLRPRPSPSRQHLPRVAMPLSSLAGEGYPQPTKSLNGCPEHPGERNLDPQIN